MKKLSIFLLALFASAGITQAAIYDGSCGANLTWSLNTQDSTLTITGSGEMTSHPWSSFTSYIKYISLPDGLTSIGEIAFFNCRRLTSVTIPNSVTSIGDQAFDGCSSLTSIIVENGNSIYDSRDNCNAIIETATNTLIAGCKNTTIPNSVTSIGDQAFRGRSGLTSVTIPNSVTSIGYMAFEYCSGLTSIVIPNSVTSIGNYAFQFCSGLTSVTIGNSVTSIGNSAFARCTGLTSVTIPNSVTSIGNSAFAYCSGLTSLTCETTTPPTLGGTSIFKDVNKSACTLYVPAGSVDAYKAADVWKEFTNILPIKCLIASGTCGAQGDNLTWELSCDSVLTISGTGEMTNYEYYSHAPWYIYRASIIDVVLLKGLTTIGDYAFHDGIGFTSIDIPNSVTCIGRSAFQDCSGLTSVTIPNSVTKIKDVAFSGCSSLTSVTIPSSVTNIMGLAFSRCTGMTFIDVASDNPKYCSVDGVLFDKEKTRLMQYPGRKQGAYTIPSSVKYINTDAFYGCSGLTSLTIGNNVIDFGQQAFYGCTNLTSVIIGDSVMSIRDQAFYDCSNLKSLTIGKSVLEIGLQAFYNCSSLTSVTIGDNVKSIGQQAFYGCTGLTSVSIGDSVKSIGQYAFSGCTGLDSVSVSDISTWCRIEFGYATANPLYYSHKLYIGGNIATDIVIPNGTEEIKNYTFSGCTTLNSVVLPDGVNRIGIGAFGNCSGLTSINIPNSVKEIASGAFSGCSSLPVIDGIRYADTYLLGAIDKTLPSYCIRNGTRWISGSAFSGCLSLVSLNIPSSVEQIGENAFSGCSSLKSIIVDEDNSNYRSVDGVLYSKDSTILYLYPLARQTNYYAICKGTQKIPRDCFRNCTYFKTIRIPSTVTYIGFSALRGCTGLEALICEAVTPPTGEKDIFIDGTSAATLYVPTESIDLYKAKHPWTYFSNVQPLDNIPCGYDTRMPAPGYTFEYTVGDCMNKLQFTNTSHVVTRYNGEEIHTTEPCTNVHWSFRRLSDKKIIETSEMNPTYLCPPEGDMIEVLLTSYLGEGNSCDSSRIDTIVVPNIIPGYSEYRYAACEGDSILFDGKWFNEDTVYTAHYTSLAGCDSTSTLFLTVSPAYEFITDTTVYVGDEVMWHNGYIKPEKAGTYHYVDTLITYFGCDSVFVLNLDVKPRSQKMCSWLVESSDLEMGVVITTFENEYYKYGTQITVEASPNSGYKFVKWNDGKKYNPYKFSLLDDKYLLAIFMADEEEQDTTTVQPSSTSATFTWPFIIGGFSYSLTIYLDVACTIPFCTITFNQYGQLIGISFGNRAPRRSMEQEDGFTYTVSGLDANTEYYFKMETMDEDNKLINTDEGAFRTTNDATGIENQYNTVIEHRKVMINGQIYILRGDKTYTLQGQEVK